MPDPWLAAAAALLLAALAVPARAYDEIRFLAPVKLDDMARPAAAAASGGRTYLLDAKKAALFLYDAEGRLLKSVGRSGSGKSEFSSPKGLAVDPEEGRVYVADTGNSRIQVLDAEGNFVGSFGVRGSTPGRLKSPESVYVAAYGRVFVADTGNDRIEVFTREGVFLYGFGSGGKEAGQFKGPTRVAVDPSDFVYVLDSGNERIQKFDPQTRFVKEMNLLGSDFALDPYGFLYVLDPKAGKVREMNPQGVMAGTFGSKGSGTGQFKDPAGIAVAPDGTILVADPGNTRLTRAVLASKLKTEAIPASRAAKLLVSGPVRTLAASAAAIAPLGEDLLVAYLPKEGQFAAFDRTGKAAFRFGAKSGKDAAAVTKGSRGLAAHPEFGIVAADTDGDKMQRFDAAGKFLEAFAGSTGFFDSKRKEGRVRSPRGVALTDKGMLFVADSGNRRVDAFGQDGSFLFAIGPSVGPHELKDPVAVSYDTAGFVYFLDRGLKKVFKCEPSGGFIAAWGEEGGGGGGGASSPTRWPWPTTA